MIACFIQGVYLLELDRQENKSGNTALAPKWWMPFKYRLSQTLIDERDGSIFGAILEWDRTAAVSDLIFMRPSGAPRAVLALRGTLLKSLTIRRDIQDDLRFFTWESLKGSVRFSLALEALRDVAKQYGSSNVCVAGHSLGAGFALQVGKALAKEGILVEAHLFNPPSVSIAMSLKNIGEKAGFVWKRFKSMLPSSSSSQVGDNEVEANKLPVPGFRNWVPSLYPGKASNLGSTKWVPHLYVNNSDYICCNYNDPAKVEEKNDEKENVSPAIEQVPAKLFLMMSKGKQKFSEAHGLEQWWSDDLELQLAMHSTSLSRQLKSLYSLPASTRK